MILVDSPSGKPRGAGENIASTFHDMPRALFFRTAYIGALFRDPWRWPNDLSRRASIIQMPLGLAEAEQTIAVITLCTGRALKWRRYPMQTWPDGRSDQRPYGRVCTANIAGSRWPNQK